MKLVPLTDAVCHQLTKEGFTHLVFRNSHYQEVFNHVKELVTLEALTSTNDEEACFPLLSDEVQSFLQSNTTEYYILVKQHIAI